MKQKNETRNTCQKYCYHSKS